MFQEKYKFPEIVGKKHFNASFLTEYGEAGTAAGRE